MVDIVDRKTRSKMMSRIRGRDTKPEIALRKRLHKMGFRYRTHCGNLPGRPDIVFAKYHAAVFVHGCFWHRHPGCRFATNPSSNTEFWQDKFAGTVVRDSEAIAKLVALGWRVAVVWECALGRDGGATSARVGNWLKGRRRRLELE